MKSATKKGRALDTDAKLKRLLSPLATNAERVRGLLLLGLAPATIALATRSSVSTVRNWTAGDTQPRMDAEVVLDDLRMTARMLLDGYEPERVARWLTSRDPDRFDGSRPVDMIRLDPMDVLAAAQAALLENAEAGQAVAESRNNGKPRTLALVGDEDS
jgi:hypothetical protein